MGQVSGVMDVGAPQWGRVAIALASSNVTLTQAQYENRVIELSGALGANVQVIVPLIDGREWEIRNDCTGNFSVTVIGASGTGVVVSNGSRCIVRTDGTNVIRVTPDLSSAGDLNAAGGYRQTIDGWYQDNVAASQAAVVLSRLGAGNAFPTKWIAPRAGSVTAVVVKSNEARSAGTLTVEVYVNGVATGLTAVLDGTNTTVKATSQNKDLDTFVAGDEIDLRITSDGSWAPTTADVRASVEVET
jgi:hypothetical protein